MRTIDPKTALVFSGFSQRQLQLIMLSDELTADLVSEPKFTQQIRRCYNLLIHLQTRTDLRKLWRAYR